MKIGILHFLTSNQEAIHQVKEAYKDVFELDKIIAVKAENQVDGVQYPFFELKEIGNNTLEIKGEDLKLIHERSTKRRS